MKSNILEEGKKALAEWAKIRDYIECSVTLSFSAEAMEQAIELAMAEKIRFNFGGLAGQSIEVPAAMVPVFSHLSPKIIREDDKDTERVDVRGRGRRKLVTAEESKEEMARQIKKWQKE